LENTLVIEGILDGIRSRADRTLAVIIGTQEMSPDQIGKLWSHYKNYIHLAVRDIPFNDEELQAFSSMKAEAPELLQRRTPSQKLRNVLYRVWEKEPEGFENFDNFYRKKVEEIISQYLKKLE